MDNETCRVLIKLYGTKDLLWNSKSPHYHNKSLRQDAWNEISSIMVVPVPELKKKMTTLMASYRERNPGLTSYNCSSQNSPSSYSPSTHPSVPSPQPPIQSPQPPVPSPQASILSPQSLVSSPQPPFESETELINAINFLSE
ncbi:hypothetical protein FQR65_LT19668 [Abscondita terminalis]|nr:hypothetical protein FQR65_LT19668 [Abscondita terminalis]